MRIASATETASEGGAATECSATVYQGGLRKQHPEGTRLEMINIQIAKANMYLPHKHQAQQTVAPFHLQTKQKQSVQPSHDNALRPSISKQNKKHLRNDM